jgi:glycosyltransferase involved in cell wall biosynthesis/predicted metal-dependent phosphoesterase TrpH
MTKVDLHVHSKYSDYPSTWGHKVYNSPESFSETEMVYQQAKSRGMDFVTLTDHDDIRGSLELLKNHPSDTFISCEITTYFPEDQCKIHILVYGIDEAQYRALIANASSIYLLRDYISAQGIAYSVAHATYDQDGKLRFEHIEKLLVLFDVFEIINGGADAQNNTLLHRYLQNLDQKKLTELAKKHKLKPISLDPWVKGFTGGSDDHCGILIGSAYTQSIGLSIDQFLTSIRDKNSLAGGMHGSFESYATGVVKHVHDYRNDRDPKYAKTKMSDFLELFFDGREGNLIKRFKKSQSLRYLKKENNKIHQALHNLLRQISDNPSDDIAKKIPMAYQHITELHDEMFRSVVTVFSKQLPSGDIFKGFSRLASIFPMTLLAAPFIGSMRHQVLKGNIKRPLIEGTKQHYTEKALWFTDTIDDLNGVSVSLRQIATHSLIHGYQLKLVTCVDTDKIDVPLPPNTLNFLPLKEVVVPGYETQSIGFPSLLTLMSKIIQEQPDQIIISTPGPLGLGAMLCAKLMDLPVKTIYHTDFAEQIMRISNEPTLATITDYCVNNFYRQSDLIFVPSKFYIEKLTRAGLDLAKMEIFPRGIDLDRYCPPTTPQSMARRHQLHGQFTLLFAGRISEDKNLKLLSKIVKQANRETPERYNMVIAGDGPDLTKLKDSLSGQRNVYFTNRLAPEDLVSWYHSADLLVFPSHTDTFGMVVLEAQACGVPCLVTPTGGPREIIKPGLTGEIVDTDHSEDWLEKIKYYYLLKSGQSAGWQQLKAACAEHVHRQNSWQPVFDAVLGDACLLPKSDITQVRLQSKINEPGRAA